MPVIRTLYLKLKASLDEKQVSYTLVYVPLFWMISKKGIVTRYKKIHQALLRSNLNFDPIKLGSYVSI